MANLQFYVAKVAIATFCASALCSDGKGACSVTPQRNGIASCARHEEALQDANDETSLLRHKYVDASFLRIRHAVQHSIEDGVAKETGLADFDHRDRRLAGMSNRSSQGAEGRRPDVAVPGIGPPTFSDSAATTVKVLTDNKTAVSDDPGQGAGPVSHVAPADVKGSSLFDHNVSSAHQDTRRDHYGQATGLWLALLVLLPLICLFSAVVVYGTPFVANLSSSGSGGTSRRSSGGGGASQRSSLRPAGVASPQLAPKDQRNVPGTGMPPSRSSRDSSPARKVSFPDL
eukprot:gnl/TRDRNA2_/TRDRNA2_169657_c0_seq2.p1 gnl/TRDRNA2_/TRDRNA2_169657_c0~~gnl/TRDRNA2_/TRDRNA2_169657_c0_seq2.p1  ORF type:complete len:302 (-),score=39.48 gnl/TRDRNA2_/TRDRNA2_169657_c0_seq2:20-880(-)